MHISTSIMQGPRAQIGRKLYKKHMQDTLAAYPTLDIRGASVFDLVFEHDLSPTDRLADGDSAEGAWGKTAGVKLREISILPLKAVALIA
jgi:tRNA uridine 5-carboxymethylaminomethyl modification enzyme